MDSRNVIPKPWVLVRALSAAYTLHPEPEVAES